jgi:hypothetical protein
VKKLKALAVPAVRGMRQHDFPLPDHLLMAALLCMARNQRCLSGGFTRASISAFLKTRSVLKKFRERGLKICFPT